MPELDTLLADLNDDVPGMSPEAFENGRARLEAAMTGRRPRRLIVLVAAAASVLAVTSAVVLTRPDAPAAPAAVNTPADLANWAKTLADDPPRVGPGQYLYERIRSTTERDLADPRFRVRYTSTGEQWVPHDYRDEWRVKVGSENVEFVRGTSADAQAEGVTVPPPSPPVDLTAECSKFAAGEHVEPCDGEGWGTTGSPAFYAGLTGDPERLYEVLEARAREEGDGSGSGIFKQADRLLQPNVPNDFKATLFQAMSKIPGLRVTDNARTGDGRDGIGVSIETAGILREQILDRTTGDLLQGRLRDARAETTGTVIYGVADELGKRPN